MQKHKVKAKGIVEMSEAIHYLEEILHSMKNRRIFVERGAERIELIPGDTAELEFEAGHKDGKQELSLEFKWKERLESGRKVDLKISSREETEATVHRAEAEAHESDDIHPEEELRHYAGTEAFGSEYEEFSPTI
ncbi:MAG TPA: amphi-Trp domain-containing protein [Desulfomonilaceae bacterium]|nr:amphi-Trp domain-containing protein [Desulfomonilaceae bacterium]